MEREVLERKLKELEKEVASLKKNQELMMIHTKFKPNEEEPKKVEIPSKIPQKSTSITEVHVKKEVPKPEYSQKVIEKPKKEIPKVERTPFDLEKQFGIWLPRVFMFILLLGVLWGLKLGMDYGVITPLMRIVGGYIVSVLMLYFGVKFIKKSRKSFGLTLLGGYIAMGLLVTFSAYELYDFIGYYVAMAISLTIVGTGVYMSSKFKSEVIILFSIVGGMLLPFIIRSEEVGTGLIFPYLTVVFVVIYIAAFALKHKYSYPIAFFAYEVAMFVPISLLGDGIESQEHFIFISFIVQHAVVLALFLLKDTWKNPFSEGLVYTSAVSLITVISLINYSYMEIVFVILGSIYLIISAVQFKLNERNFFVTLSISIIFISAFIIAWFENDFYASTTMLLVTSTLGLAIGIKFKDWRNIIVSGALFFWTLMVSMFATWPSGLFSAETVLIVLSIVSILGIFVVLIKKYPTSKSVKDIIVIPFIYAIISLLKLIFDSLDSFHSVLVDNGLDFLNIETLMIAVIAALFFTIMYLTLIKFKDLFFAKSIFITTYVFNALLGCVSLIISALGSNDEYFIWAIVYGLYIAGFIYIMKNTIDSRETSFKFGDSMKNGAVIFTTWIVILCSNVWFAYIADRLPFDYEMTKAIHTLFLFILAAIAIKVSSIIQYRSVKKIGYLIIVFAIIKLLLFDLSSYSLIIRAGLFLIVGVVGLIYSKKINKQD